MPARPLHSQTSVPVGYNAVFYADGLADGGAYAICNQTDDSRRTHPPYNSCIGYFIVTHDDFFVAVGGNALGYGVAYVADANADSFPLLVLHTNGSTLKGPLDTFGPCAGKTGSDEYRDGGPFSFDFQDGGPGPAIVDMGVLSGSPGPGDGEASLDWAAATPDVTPGIDFTVSYEVFRGTSPGALALIPGAFTHDLVYVDSGLEPGVYYYQVSAGVDLGLGEHIHGGGDPGSYSTDFLSNIIAVTVPETSSTVVLDGARYRIGEPLVGAEPAEDAMSLDELRYRIGEPGDVESDEGVDLSRVHYRIDEG